MSEGKKKPLTYAQLQYLDRLKRYGDARITNRTAGALEKAGLVVWRRDRSAPWGGEWVLADGSTPPSFSTPTSDASAEGR